MDTYKTAVLLKENDSVAVAVEDCAAGDTVRLLGRPSPDERDIVLNEPVARGHKFALKDMTAGSPVYKYGMPIGRLQADVPRGSWVHSHNLASALHGELAYEAPPDPYDWPEGNRLRSLLNDPASHIPAEFMAYRRPDGRVGIRNEIWVLPTVGCVNKTADRLAEWARHQLGAECYAFTHPFGCSQLGDDLATTRTILARLATHPNAAGVLVISLGCENNRLEALRKEIGDGDRNQIRYLPMQEVEDEMEAAQTYLSELTALAQSQQRSPISLSELVIGLKCGGSDGLSGITSNPVVGRVCEMLVAAGGSSLMTEVPEMFGAETELMARSAAPAVFEKTVRMVNSFKEYFISHGQEVYENPSPGNKDGGITTLEEKSLGAIGKAGKAPVSDVIDYGARVATKGLTLVSGPGNDLVSTTALSAAGAHIILFTTGRGTPFGAPAPTLKISSNTSLAERKPNWIDFDAGRLLSGNGFDELALELLRLIIATAEGKQTKCEISGNRDIAIFKDGVIL